MHICIVAPEQIPVPPVLGGSVEICILAIARKLAEEHQVTIVSRNHPRYSQVQIEGNLTIVRVPTNGPSKYIASVLNYLRGKHFDLIQVDNRPRFAAKIKAAFPEMPVSVFLHSLTYVTPPMTSKASAAAHLSKADLIVANSSNLHSRLSGMFPKVKHKIRKVLLGVDLNRFRPPTDEEKRKIRSKYKTGNAFTVLFAGRVIPRKGIPVLLRAMKIVRKTVRGAKLVIAGGGKKGYVQSLKREARALGVPAIFAGYLPHYGIHRIYRVADCFACPSQKHEAFGLVNVEAIATGVPVVASNIGGIKEIVKSGRNGYLVDRYKEPKAFARFIVKIARDRSLALSLSENARADAVKRFGWSATASRLASVYTHKLQES
jgi:spore coat protein SA